MVRSCPCLVNISDLAELTDNFTLKISPLVTMVPTWEAIVTDKVFKENLSRSMGSLILGRNGLSKPSLVVGNDKNVFITAKRHF